MAFDYVGIDDDIVDAAMNESDLLRSLDAIHLATARLLGRELAAFVTYDNRLACAASAAGFTVTSPRD